MRALGFGRSAIWGGATAGLIIGFLWGLFTGNIGNGIKNGVIIGAALGIITELLGFIGDRLKKIS